MFLQCGSRVDTTAKEAVLNPPAAAARAVSVGAAAAAVMQS